MSINELDGNSGCADLKNGTFMNPILRGNYADPSIIRVENDYYMVNTSYQYVPGLLVWHSTNLVNWEPIGSALTEFNGNVWAPDFVHYKDMYYIYFPADKTNWVTTAKDPRGPWSKPINLHTSHIDPGHVVGPDQKRYLHLSDGHMVELSDDGLSVAGEVRKVYEPWTYPEDWEVEAFSPEGPKLRYYNGYYYLLIAVGGTAGPPTSHMVAASRSKTPWGPWEHSPHNPILKTSSKEEYWWSQGHGTLIDTPNGEWWMVYHAYENSFHTLGRHSMLVPIEWTEDGWPKVVDGIRPDRPIKMPEGKKGSHGFPQKDYFDSRKLGLHWQWLGHPEKERFLPVDGSLTVTGKDGSIYPILYMAGHRSYEAEIDVMVKGDAEAKFMLFYDQSNYLGLSVSREGVRHFRTFKHYRVEPYEGRSIRLRIKNDEHIVSFYYKEENGQWKKYDKVLDASGFHHNTFGGFLSLRIGLDVTGNGKAYFKQFEYRVCP
ncbi:family 43 glycosylhydrolase [Bacillus sp. MRMR6]|uniref:family 43 glycosylhydrolase n=1 Tax=Bacillus sp. MRMR6 TaxID=1928617 RepID=UPI0009518004|nr:family 43 glycosylhydrolase [Bacillus sp. MRMR6]OLS35548.1 xylan 1,4-beta-xylosidase [Bacillus sp. MRMR6]